MKIDQIEAARTEAQRFLEKTDAALNAIRWVKSDHGGYWTNNDTRATAALRRASMDLTRALADLRRPDA